MTKKSFAVLNEMRGFRHVFRSSYMFTIDVERLNLVANRNYSPQKNMEKN